MNWNLQTYSGVVYKDYLWFSNNTFNGLFRLSTKSMKMEFVGFFPCVDYANTATHKKCIRYNDKLFFLPAFSDYIHIYDISDDKFETIHFNRSLTNSNKDRVSDAVLVGENIYIFSWLEGEPLFIFGVHDFSLNRCREFDNEIKQIEGRDTPLLTRCGVNSSNEICFGIWNTDMLAKWSIDDRKISVTHTGIKHIFSAHVIEEDTWIVPMNERKIFKVGKSNDALEFRLSACNTNVNKRQFSRISRCNDFIFGVPAFSNDMFIIKEGRVITLSGEEWNNIYPEVPAFFSDVSVNGQLWILPFSTEKMLIYDQALNCLQQANFCLQDIDDKKTILKMNYKRIVDDGKVYENDDFMLSDYVVMTM